MFGTSGVQDVNISRIVDETLLSVEDVERRLQSLKIAVAQSFPQIAPILQQRELHSRNQILTLLGRINPAVGLGHVGFPGSTLPFGPMGTMPFGVTAPSFVPPLHSLSAVHPYGALGQVPFLGASFRPW